MKEPRIEYWKSANDSQWYTRIKAGNGKIVGHGGGHQSHDKCLDDIAALRLWALFALWQSEKDGLWYFNAQIDGEVLVQSEGYTRKAGAQRGIRAFQNIVRTAPVIRAAR